MTQGLRRLVRAGEVSADRAAEAIADLCFMCADATAIYRELVSRGIAAQRPFVGNGLWVPEETIYSDALER